MCISATSYVMAGVNQLMVLVHPPDIWVPAAHSTTVKLKELDNMRTWRVTVRVRMK